MTATTNAEIDHDALLARADSLPPTDGIGADCLITQMALAIRALRDQREAADASIAELRGVIEKAHHIVTTSDRIWGGMDWVYHPINTVVRKQLQRILENRPAAMSAQGEK